ncbi:MAG: DUF1592 domain-containing protein, partial [Myxococcota bacterium]
MARIGLIAAVLLVACQGTIDGAAAAPDDPSLGGAEGAPGMPAPSEPGEPAPLEENVPTELRRLSRDEFARSFDMLFGFRPPALQRLGNGGSTFAHVPPEEGQSVDSGWFEVYEAALDELVDHVLSGELAACGDGDRNCVEALAARVVGPALREHAPDLQPWLATYEGAESHEIGVYSLLHRLLQSPFFVFHLEGLDQQGEPVANLSPFETAARLSFAYCHRVPDAALLAAAAEGALETPEGRWAQAERLLDVCAAFTLENFVGQWLSLYSTAESSPAVLDHPAVDYDYIAGADREWRAYVEDVVRNERSFQELFAGDHTVADARLQSAYPDAELSDAPARIALPDHRRGLLNLPAFFLTMARGSET